LIWARSAGLDVSRPVIGFAPQSRQRKGGVLHLSGLRLWVHRIPAQYNFREVKFRLFPYNGQHVYRRDKIPGLDSLTLVADDVWQPLRHQRSTKLSRVKPTQGS